MGEPYPERRDPSVTIALIWAMDRNRLIGRDNDLPWRLKADLQFFKKTTLGRPIIMGRKTWESLPFKPLPGRTNIVLTRSADYVAEGAEVVRSADEALAVAEQTEAEVVMVIGGAGVYRSFLPRADRLYITEIDDEFDGDTWFPRYDATEWVEVSRESHDPDESNPYPFAFVTYERVEQS